MRLPLPPPPKPPANLEPLRKVVLAFFRAFFFVRFTGQENLPFPSPALIAPNHLSYLDFLLVHMGQHDPIRYMAWDELFDHPWFGQLLLNWGAFPIDPDAVDPGAFRKCLELLKRGERVGIFPEGERSTHGGLMPLHDGVARIAIHAQAPVYPVRIAGADHVWIKGDFCPRPFFPVHIHYCPPIQPRAVKGATEKRAETRRIMSELRVALAPREEGNSYEA